MAKESVITDVVVARMIADAPLDAEKCEVIATDFGIPVKSVIASATRRKIEYVKKPRLAKDGSVVTSKEDLVSVLSEIVGESLEGLEKATKASLQTLVTFFEVKAFEDAEDAEESE